MVYSKRVISREWMKCTGKIVTVHVTNWYGAVKVLLSFLISEMEGNELPAPQFGRFSAARRDSNTRLIE